MIFFCNSNYETDNYETDDEEINDTNKEINYTDKYKNQKFNKKKDLNNMKNNHSLDQISIKKVILFLVLGALTLYGVFLIYIHFSTRNIDEINDLRNDIMNLSFSINDFIDNQNENHENIIKLKKIKKELDELYTQIDSSKLLKDDIKFNSIKSLFEKNKEEFQQIKKDLD
jgi:hypothetical protein